MIDIVSFFLLLSILLIHILYFRERHRLNCPYYYKYKYELYHCPYCRRFMIN